MPHSIASSTVGRVALLASAVLASAAHVPAGAQSVAAPTPAAPAVAAAADRWEDQVAAYEAQDRDRPPAPGGICLVGSSNIRLWTTLDSDFPGMNVVNRGVGGCRLAELADFAPRLVAAARPRVIVVSAGTNDVSSGATAEEVRDAFARLVATLRRGSPKATIAFLAIAPSIKRQDQLDSQRAANEAVLAFITSAGDARLRYLDTSAAFLGPDGRLDPACFVEDLQHPSAAGNARRAAILRPALADWLRAAE